jgi:hypothetical protein
MQDEILKHTKKIFNEVKNPKHSFGEKIKEIIIEVLIIVFAVTLSIWLHGWSEERHQEKEAHTFLIGLKEDLQNDISNLENTKKTLNITEQQVSFVMSLTTQKIDSIRAKNQQINSGSNFINTLMSNGRYEGFKSSGKINTIENEKLRSKILSYYQQRVPQIALIESSYEKMNTRYVDGLLDELEDDDINKTFLKKKTKIILSGIVNFTKQNQESYKDAIKEAKSIIDMINENEK